MPDPDPSQYDAFAAEYEGFAATAPYNALYDRPATLELLGDVDGLRILDAACGPGLYAEVLVARGAEVIACDGSERMVEVARRRLGSSVDVRHHSLDQPLAWLPDASVDRVLCALAYHYLNDRPLFLREAARVLRPGGRLVISTDHPSATWRRLGGSYFDVTTITETWSLGWTVTQWRAPLGVLTDEFAAAGFVIERLVEALPQPEMAESHPETFEKLSNEPGFVLFALMHRAGHLPGW